MTKNEQKVLSVAKKLAAQDLPNIWKSKTFAQLLSAVAKLEMRKEGYAYLPKCLFKGAK